MTAVVQIIVMGLVAVLSLVGAGLGWWHGTTTFYVRTVYADPVSRPMSARRRVQRHLRRIFLTLAGATVGAMIPILGVMLLKR